MKAPMAPANPPATIAFNTFCFFFAGFGDALVEEYASDVDWIAPNMFNDCTSACTTCLVLIKSHWQAVPVVSFKFKVARILCSSDHSESHRHIVTSSHLVHLQRLTL